VFCEQMTSSSQKFLCMFKIKFSTKRIFRIFPILWINEMAPFCDLFVERRSYMRLVVTGVAECKSFLNCTSAQNRPFSAFKAFNLQVWLSHLAEEMKNTLQELLKSCLRDAKSGRGGLDPNKYPSQVLTDLYFFTSLHHSVGSHSRLCFC